METKLTKLQAYNAMIKFLDIYYEQTKSDDLGSLLGVMQFLVDGGTADPAIWKDWLDSVNSITSTKEKITTLEAYKAMIKFLEIYCEFTKSDDVRSLLAGMKLISDENTVEFTVWNNWINCVYDALHEAKGYKPLLNLVSTDKKF